MTTTRILTGSEIEDRIIESHDTIITTSKEEIVHFHEIVSHYNFH